MPFCSNLQVHESPYSRNWLAIFGLGSLVVLLGTGSLRAAADTLSATAVLVFPMWVWLGRFAKSIRRRPEGLDITLYNRTVMHIAWADLVRTEIRPKTSGSYVDIYSKTARPITFDDSISGYGELMAEIHQHLDRGIEQEPVACTKEPSERERRILRVVVVAGWFVAFGVSMVFPEVLLRPSAATLALSLGVLLLALICVTVLCRMTFVSTASRVSGRKALTVCMAAFAILFIVVAAQIRGSDPRLTVAFLVAAAICCVTGSLTPRILNDRSNSSIRSTTAADP